MLSVPLQQCPTKRLRQLCIGLHEAGLLPSDLDTAKLQDRQYCTRLLAQLQLISGFEEQRQLCLPRPIFTVKTLQIILLSGFGETKANCKLKDQYLLKLGEIMQDVPKEKTCEDTRPDDRVPEGESLLSLLCKMIRLRSKPALSEESHDVAPLSKQTRCGDSTQHTCLRGPSSPEPAQKKSGVEVHRGSHSGKAFKTPIKVVQAANDFYNSNDTREEVISSQLAATSNDKAEHEPHVSDEAGADRGKVSSTSVGSKANDQVEQLDQNSVRLVDTEPIIASKTTRPPRALQFESRSNSQGTTFEHLIAFGTVRYAALALQAAPDIAVAVKTAKGARKSGSKQAKGMLNRTANRPLVDVLQLSFQPLNERLCDEELWNVSSDGDDTIKLYWDKPPNDEGFHNDRDQRFLDAKILIRFPEDGFSDSYIHVKDLE